MKRPLRELLEKIFPAGEERKQSSELVEQSLKALRTARDERAVPMGDVRRVPSRLELRLSEERYEELKSIDAVRDLEYFLTDEMMKDLMADRLRTFGDHNARVTVAADADLAPHEISAAVLTPEKGNVRGASISNGGGASDATRVPGQAAESPTVVVTGGATVGPDNYRVTVSGPGEFRIEEQLIGTRWIIGRQGGTGRRLPEGYHKVDLDLPETISREQVRVDIHDTRMRLERIGKAAVSVPGGDHLQEGENRMIPLGLPFYVDQFEIRIEREGNA